MERARGGGTGRGTAQGAGGESPWRRLEGARWQVCRGDERGRGRVREARGGTGQLTLRLIGGERRQGASIGDNGARRPRWGKTGAW